jgi:putative transposase
LRRAKFRVTSTAVLKAHFARPLVFFFAYPNEICKVIYTPNAIESLNISLRKVTKNRGSFPNDAAMFKLLYLALNNISKKWTRPIRDWKGALNRFSILFEGRMPIF